MSDEAREDGGMKDTDISGALGVGLSMVERVRRRHEEEGIESALNRKSNCAAVRRDWTARAKLG